MKNPAISLIIPVYNVEKYLEKALKSVENQTFKDFEVIIVDDGSTDSSIKIINEFCERNSNFKLITQKNSGPAVARNTALSISRGSYIAFMDSDDYIEPNFLESLYSAAIKNNADIACCNFNNYYPKKNLKIYLPFNSPPGVYTRRKALKKLILDIGMHYFVWNKLCKREIFFDNNLKFDDMYFEDISISPKMFYYAKKIVLIREPLYNYTSRENSILHSITTKKTNDFIKSLGIIRNFLEINKAYKDYKSHLWFYAQKAKLVSYYYILGLHNKASNFKGFIENISCAKKSIDYFVSDEFKLRDYNIPVRAICPIKTPTNKTQKSESSYL